MTALLDNFGIEDLPNEKLREVARTIGMSNFKALMIRCPGMVYIPKTLNSFYHKKYIKENFKGDNYKEVAEHLGVTERTVYRHASD